MTAPIDGGIGDNIEIRGAHTLNFRLPDNIILKKTNNGQPTPYVLYTVGNVKIGYCRQDDPSNTIRFLKTGDGLLSTPASDCVPYEGANASLKQIVEGGHGVYYGHKSGTAGVGNLSVIKARAEQFYTELPDAIVATAKSNYEIILPLKLAIGATSQTNGQNFVYEARLDAGSARNSDYIIVFRDDDKGTFEGHAGHTDNFASSMEQHLRWFIENGRALYYGSEPSTSRIGQKDFITDDIPIAAGLELPDAIIGKDDRW